MNDNAHKNKTLELGIEAEFDFEEMEGDFSKQLEDSFSDLSLLEDDRKSISNPDALGKTIFEEVWRQFGYQIGLDITDETLVQQYDREHPEEYKDIAPAVKAKPAYIEVAKAMKVQQRDGRLIDEYTKKPLRRNDKANLDHVVPIKELFGNKRRKQANFSVAELANKEENLNPTNESLNKAKGAKTNKQYLDYVAKNKDTIRANAERKKNAIEKDDSQYDIDKKLGIKKIDKSVEDRLSADPGSMKKADRTARKAISRVIAPRAAQRICTKAARDAIKIAAITALFGLLKEIMRGFVRFLKSEAKSFSSFLAEIKKALTSFFSKIMSVVQTGVLALIGTIVSEIIGPIVRVFAKFASLIKQGVSSFADAINYLKDKSNKDKPFSVKVAQVGKIVTAGLTVGGALVLGEVFEKLLLTVPGLQFVLPTLGTLANLIGLFLGSLISGIVGALILNLIDRFIAKTRRSEITKEIIQKQNDVVNFQQLQKFIAENKVERTKSTAASEIRERHDCLREQMIVAVQQLSAKPNARAAEDTIIVTENSDDFSQMQNDLEDLL